VKNAAVDEPLNAGDMVLAGSFTRPITALRGDSIRAACWPLGSVALRLV